MGLNENKTDHRYSSPFEGTTAISAFIGDTDVQDEIEFQLRVSGLAWREQYEQEKKLSVQIARFLPFMEAAYQMEMGNEKDGWAFFALDTILLSAPYLKMGVSRGFSAGIGRFSIEYGVKNEVEYAAKFGVSLDRAGNGMSYASKILEGGTGRALAGHGELRAGLENFMTVVPEGSSITNWIKPGVRMPDSLGRAIELGAYESIYKNPDWVQLINGAHSALPGTSVPNYFLKTPDRLTIFKNSITVDVSTPLSTLFREYSGHLEWAACTVLE
jgi:hypothetical protein